MIDFSDHFSFFSILFCTLKYLTMMRIRNISFFRFGWKNKKLDWPKCARTRLHGLGLTSFASRTAIVSQSENITGINFRGRDNFSERFYMKVA